MGMIKGQFLNFMYRCPVPLNGGFEFFNGRMTNKDTNGGSRVLTLTGIANGVKEVSQGVLAVALSRPVGAICTSWGGAEDMAARVSVYNYAANLESGTLGGIKGLRVYARQYSGGNCFSIFGLEVSVDDRGSAYGGKSCSTFIGQTITTKNNTTVGSECHGLVIQDDSQGSFLTRTGVADSLLYIRSFSNRATGKITAAIHFGKTDSGVGFNYTFSFANNDGSEGFTYADSSAFNDTAGYISILVGSTPYYIPVYKGIS